MAFDEDKAWLNPDLKLKTLAEQLCTNRNKLSILINQLYGTDFKTLVAERRIAEAKRLMKENPTATIESIAYQCGFKESSLFFHRFKDITGETPTVWRLKN